MGPGNMKILYDELVRQTEKAIQIRIGKEKYWIPISQIEKEDLVGQTMELPAWLVAAKKLEKYKI